MFEGFTPTAKLVNGKAYSIISDHIGKPIQAIDDNGELVWSADYDIYGRLKNVKGERTFIPFRQAGQIEDAELERLYYNRYRWYNSETGTYISQDPIGLAGGNPTIYGYVHAPNTWLDVFGLKSNSVELARNLTKKPQGNYAAHHIVMTGTNDTQMNTHGININGAENGIWLPKRDSDKVQGQAQTSHQQDGLHGKAYKQELFDRLNGKNKQDFLAELSKIKEELNKGRTWETQTTKKLKKCIR